MPRKLKTYVTSAGFFDLAVAAPSMKAALEAWGAGSNFFHQGFARETHEPGVVAATAKRPGVVLRRAVGTQDAFSEDAPLPRQIAVPKPKPRPKHPPAKETPRAGLAAPSADERTQRRERRADERARPIRDARRDRAVAAAEAALENARKNHDTRMSEIDRRRQELDARAAGEIARWQRTSAGLERALREARSGRAPADADRAGAGTAAKPRR